MDLSEVAKLNATEWYFFSFRDRKYATGFRTNRATTSGYWKATGKDRTVLDPMTREIVGMRKTLVFYRNRAPNGIKTGWIMHEFRLETPHMPPKVRLLLHAFGTILLQFTRKHIHNHTRVERERERERERESWSIGKFLASFTGNWKESEIASGPLTLLHKLSAIYPKKRLPIFSVMIILGGMYFVMDKISPNRFEYIASN